MELLKIMLTIFLVWHPLPTLADRNDNAAADLSSLIFVFDVTASMGSELSQVKAEALKILQQLSQNEHKIIHDYIFVPFNDPNVGPVIRTTNATQFDEMLRKLTVDGGGDCPEMCLTGIKQGLELGLQQSFLFVFTDADPKDSELLPEVLTAITEKRTQVIFILTDSCSSKGFSPVYQQIATTSNGLIFDIKKGDTSEVLKFIQFNVKSRRVDLLAVDDHQTRSKRDQKFDVPVDETMKELVVSLVAAKDSVLKVTSPSGHQFSDSSFCNTFLEVKSTRMCSVLNPEKGIWILLLEAITSFSLRVSAASNITFDFGFEVFQDDQTAVMNKASCQPIEGAENTFFIKLNDTSQIASLTSGQIISLEGQMIKSFPLKPVQQKDDLYYGSFIPTNISYHLQIKGETKSGSEFQRLTSVAFSSLSNNTQELRNCTAKKIDYIPKTAIENSSFRQVDFQQSRIICWFLAVTLSKFSLIILG